jgi:hypothetical protein
MTGKKIVKVWSFKSAHAGGRYQTLQYDDGSTSCDCFGWTRRCKNGQRSCKHTRDVALGIADETCDMKTGVVRPKVKTGGRQYDFGEYVSRT